MKFTSQLSLFAAACLALSACSSLHTNDQNEHHSNQAKIKLRKLEPTPTVHAAENEKIKRELEAATKAIEANPKSADMYYERASILYRAENYAGALADLNKALSKKSKNSQLHFLRGLTLDALHRYAPAIESLTLALKQTPSNTNILFTRAHCYDLSGEPLKAIADLTSIIQREPFNSICLEQRSYLYQEMGFAREALIDAKRAMQLRPGISYPCLLAAKAALTLGDNLIALDYVNQAIKFDISSAAGYQCRAEIHETLGNKEKMLEDLKAAYKLASQLGKYDIQRSHILSDFENSSLEKSTRALTQFLEHENIHLPFRGNSVTTVCVSVIVDGRDLDLVLDTGSNVTTICKQAVSFSSRKAGKPFNSPDAGGKPISYIRFRSKTCEIGKLKFEGCNFPLQNHQKDGGRDAGSLGCDILKYMVATVDYKNREVILSADSRQWRSKNATIVPMNLHHESPACLVTMNGKQRLAMLDTGSDSSYAPSALVTESPSLHFNDEIHGPWLGHLKATEVMLDEIEIGKFIFKRPSIKVFRPSDAPALSSKLILGAGFLRQFDYVTFDFPCREIIFAPVTKSARVSHPHLMAAHQNIGSKKYREGIYNCSRAIALSDKPLHRALHLRAYAYEKTKNNRASLQDLEEWSKLDPANAEIYHYRSLAHKALKEYTAQLITVSKAIELAPNHAKYFKTRGDAYKALGKPEMAQRDYARAKALEKSDWCEYSTEPVSH